LALLLALLPLAGCLAQAQPARETLIENVAPLPAQPPGVEVRWETSGPVLVQPGTCVDLPWLLRAHAVARPAPLRLDVQGSRGLDGRLVSNVTPGIARVEGNALANGTATICAPDAATQGEGELALLANAGNTTVALSSVRVVVTR
jgi:hypothetical protein